MPDPEELPELGPAEYLRDLAERLMHVPAMYGTDGYDCDRLKEIARVLAAQPIMSEIVKLS